MKLGWGWVEAEGKWQEVNPIRVSGYSFFSFRVSYVLHSLFCYLFKDLSKDLMIESALRVISIFSVSSKFLSSIAHTNPFLISGKLLALSHREERLMVISYRLMCDTSEWLILITGIR
jgi:hypothetical protein